MIITDILRAKTIGQALGVTDRTVRNLWNGYTRKDGVQVPPELPFNVDSSGRRYSTRQQLQSYVARKYPGMKIRV